MRRTAILAALALVVAVGSPARARGAEPGSSDGIDTMPILRLEPPAPTSFVSALVFNPASGTLYAGSWDKIVRAWAFDPQTGTLAADPAGTYRVPLGPDLSGAINAVDVSPDGQWLAVAGVGVMRGASDLRHPGLRIPALGTQSPEVHEDRGTIFVFDTRTREVRLLRGHRGTVSSLAFVQGGDQQTPVLLSVGEELNQPDPRYGASVRAWDVQAAWQDKAQPYLVGQMLPPIRQNLRIAAWRVGAAPRQVRAAIGSGDAGLQIWDVAANTLARDAAGGQFRNAVVWWGDARQLVTGKMGGLSLWEAAGVARAVAEVPLDPGDTPFDIGLFASRAGGRVDRAAVVVVDPQEIGWLRIVDLEARRRLADADVRLWRWNKARPAVAVDPRTRQLAVAGQANHEILSFAIDALLSGRAEPRPLSGNALSVGGARLAQKGDAHGILLSVGATDAEPAPAEALIFDPARGSVSRDVQGWQAAVSEAGQWRVETAAASDKRWFCNVFEPHSERRGFWLPADRTGVTAHALRAGGAPLLAVASRTIGGTPRLELYDAAAGPFFGACLRELSGHVDRIDSASFSADGDLLITAARDHVVCVWSLDDLDTVVGRRGTIADVRFDFDAANRALVVQRVDGDGRNRQELAAGDVLLGWVEDGRTLPIDAPTDFYLRLSNLQPGTLTPPLAVRRGANPPREVRLAIAQATDERKPLCSLFFTREEPTGWIGWSPLGPYEASGPGVGQILGWHFNLGFSNPQRLHGPTRFAALAEYQEFERPGLVDALLRQRVLPPVRPSEPERPDMALRLKHPRLAPIDYTDREETVRFGRDSRLELELVGLAADQVQEVALETADGMRLALDPVSAQVWSAPLARLPQQRAPDMPAVLRVTTSGASPQTFTKPLALAYQGEPPAIEVAEPAEDPSVTDGSTLRVKAHTWSLEGGRDVVLRVFHKAGDKEAALGVPAGAVDVDLEVPLVEGDNTITIEAANAAAPGELTRVVRRVVRNPLKVPPPRLLVRAVSPESGVQRELTSDRSEPLVVDSAELRLEGSVAAEGPLAEVRWGVNQQDARCDNFVPGAAAPFEVRQAVILQAGEQVVRCRAQAEGGLPTEARLTVVFAPLPAEPLIVEPAADSRRFEGRDPPSVPIRFRLVPAEAIGDAAILVNGKPAGVEARAAGDGTFVADVPLDSSGSGENHVAVQVSNAWGTKRTSNEVVVSYLRPPQIVAVDAPETVSSPLLEFAFEVEAPEGSELTGLEVSGWLLPLSAATFDPATRRWKVVARDVPLHDGVNEIVPRARNAHGWSVDAKRVRVKLAPPAPLPAVPTIAFQSPAADGAVAWSEYPDVRFTVRSTTPLRQVVLRQARGKSAAPDVAIDVARQVELPDGQGFQLAAAIDRLELARGDNHLEVVAVNDGGESSARRVVTYVAQPVRLFVDQLVSGGVEQAAERPAEGEIRFAAAAARGNDVVLRGHVQWADADTQRHSGIKDLHVWVNGLLQRPVPLAARPGAGAESTWEVKLRLNKPRDNAIEIGVPRLPREATRSLAFTVDCQQPDRSRRLHLLVVGVGEEQPQQLEALALAAVGAKPSGNPAPRAELDGRRFAAPAFDDARIYQLSERQVFHSAVVARIRRIRLRILGASDPGGDVVIVYYRGQEEMDSRGQYCLTTSDEAAPIDQKDLAQFADLPGAQLFFLDVQRASQERPTVWPSQPHTAAMRYVWPLQQNIPANASLLDRFHELAVNNTANRVETRLDSVSDVAREGSLENGALQYEVIIHPHLGDLVLVRP